MSKCKVITAIRSSSRYGSNLKCSPERAAWLQWERCQRLFKKLSLPVTLSVLKYQTESYEFNRRDLILILQNFLVILKMIMQTNFSTNQFQFICSFHFSIRSIRSVPSIWKRIVVSIGWL